MLVGKDFDKIEWQWGDWIFLEPNALIGDTLLSILAIVLAFRVRKISKNHAFYTNWFWFFIIFGIGLFAGGLGHFLWNYLGITGKYFSWYASILAVFYIEQAMISLYPKPRVRFGMTNWSIIKLFLAMGGLSLMIYKVDLAADVSKGLLIPSINSAIGMILSLVILTKHYEHKDWGEFKFFQWGVLILVPSAFFQFLKINFAPWFDRNDASHVLLAITVIFYFMGISKLRYRRQILA